MDGEILEKPHFEGDEEEKEESLIKRLGKFLIALFLIFLMIYFSGPRDFLFFRRTPEEVTVRKMDPIVDMEEVFIPVRVLALREEVFGTSRNDEEIESLIENSFNIMAQAEIYPGGVRIEERELSREEIGRVLEGDFNFLNPKRGEINIILVKSLGGLNGIAFPGRSTTIIPDYTAGRDYRTLAHEIGHLFGLDHQERGDMVMSQGSYGVHFSVEEVLKMRKNIDEKF